MANQYANLLAEVTGQGQYGINTATSAEAALMAQRGQLGVNGQNQISQAQQGAETTAAANEGSIQTAAAGAQAGIAEDIAGIQTGAAGTNLNYGLNVGSLAQQLAVSELPYTQVQASGIQVPANNSLLVPSTVGNSLKFETGGNTVVSNSKGGVLPGYAPGRDDIRAKLSPGEGVLTPEAVRLIGADKINWINKIAMRMSGRDNSDVGGGGPSSGEESIKKALEILKSMNSPSRKPQASMSQFVH